VIPPGNLCLCHEGESACLSTDELDIKMLDPRVENRTEPKTVSQWVRYIVVALIALFLVWWMLRLYVF
jgi:hypothetical protein